MNKFRIRHYYDITYGRYQFMPQIQRTFLFFKFWENLCLKHQAFDTQKQAETWIDELEKVNVELNVEIVAHNDFAKLI